MIRKTTNPSRRPKLEPEVRNSRKRTKAAAPSPHGNSKAGMVESLLGRPRGASLGELVAATGWQSHTIRAALSGLRKKGHTIVRDNFDGASRYLLTSRASVSRAEPAAKKKGGRS